MFKARTYQIFLFRYLMIKCESATVSPLYSIHGTLPFSLNPPFSVNYKSNTRENTRMDMKKVSNGLDPIHTEH